jgi:tetratricopeptide (TPR) repeat protein
LVSSDINFSHTYAVFSWFLAQGALQDRVALMMNIVKQKITYPSFAAWVAAAFLFLLGVALVEVEARADQLPGEGGREETLSRDDRLQELFDELQQAAEGFDATVTEKTILSVWSQSGSPTVDLLMDRASAVIMDGDDGLGMSLYNRVAELKPDYAEVWHRRSQLHLLQENYTEAMVDLQKTLILEPRHFIAIQSLGNILLETGDHEAALSAFRMALKLNPHMKDVRQAIDNLTHQVEGRGI